MDRISKLQKIIATPSEGPSPIPQNTDLKK